VPNVEKRDSARRRLHKNRKNGRSRKTIRIARFIEQQFGNLDQRRLALLWADRGINLDEALAIAERGYTKRAKTFLRLTFTRGVSTKRTLSGSEKRDERSAALKDERRPFFHHAGMIEKELGNKKAAADFLNRALQTNPSFDLLQLTVQKRRLPN
jgi:hypothetical protein